MPHSNPISKLFIVVIIIIIITAFMQGIYTYIPKKNSVPREYIVAAILLLLFMVPISIVPALLLLLSLLLYVIVIKIRNATLTPHVNTNSCCGYRDSKAYL
jgi:chromate transport protein ChrA